MYAQFFGSYLLSRNVVEPGQLSEAIARLSEARIKLGTLAMHSGLMTAEAVDEVCYLQTREDKRFGEIAIERELLTEEQVSELLEAQSPDYLLLGQNLVDLGAISNTELENLLADYQKETGLKDLRPESTDQALSLVRKYFQDHTGNVNEHAVTYANLLFNDLVRFVGDDYTPLPPVAGSEFALHYCVGQEINGPVSGNARLDMTEDVAIQFASRYAKMEFEEFDEYVRASVEDFLNLHNGLFTVNMSNDYSIELSLEPPMAEETDVLILDDSYYVIPVVYPFGTIHLILHMEQ